jgi:Uncharacterised conserved protein/CLEC16A C-terminal
VQLLQSASLLVHNLREDESKDYLLASDFYREILSHPFDFTDDEIIENYMSVLKGLAVNLSEIQLKQYLINNHYALFTGAMMFFNYPESLIKTASRTVVLHVLGGMLYLVNDQTVESFIIESGLFYNLVSNLKESIIDIERSAAAFKSLAKLETVTSECLDLLYHLNDIFSKGREVFCIKLSDVLLKGLILPILVSGLIAVKLKPYHVSMHISLFMLSQIISIIKYPPLIDPVISLIFDNLIWESYYNVIVSPPNRDSPLLVKSTSLIENPVKTTIFSFLRCKEDNLTGLSLHLLHSSALFSTEVLLEPKENLSSSEKYRTFMLIIQDILQGQGEFRFFTCYLASKLMLDLSKNFPLQEKIEDNIIKEALKIKTEDIMIILSNIKDHVYLLKIFEEEWNTVKNLNWVGKVDIPLNYILPSIDEVSAGIPLEQRRCVTEDDVIRNDIRLFLVYRKLRYVIIPDDIPPGLDYDKFPLRSISDSNYKLNEVYEFRSGQANGKDLVKIVVKGINAVKFVVDDPDYFILARHGPDEDLFVIETVAKFSKVSVQDRPEPKVMVINIDKLPPLFIAFDEYQTWIILKNKIEKKSKEGKENDIHLLRSFINQSN